MNWKERLNELDSGGWVEVPKEIMEDFISTEIIEKLIADAKYVCSITPHSPELLEQQLRQGWL